MVTYRRRAAAELEVMLEALEGVQRQLDDRDGSVRKGMHQHRPGAVIDPQYPPAR